MRLIDADEIDFNKAFGGKSGFAKDMREAAQMLVDKQPTTFDAEKVVKELEDLKMRYFLTLANTGDAEKDCAYLNTANVIDKAIEIVKRGGRDGKERI